MGALPAAPIPARIICEHVIVPTLQHLAQVEPRIDSPAARKLLLGTAAHESAGFRYIFQAGAGPARSLWQIEPATGFSSVMLWLDRRPDLQAAVAGLAWSNAGYAEQYGWNHAFACALARVYYWRCAAPLPDGGDLPGLAGYWKRYFNTPLGKGTPAEWIRDYHRHCDGVLP